MGQIRNENVKESPMTRFGGTGTPDNRSRRLRNPSFTAAEWTSNNPLLQLGEIGYETDTHKTKIGDGVTYWTDLPYQFDDVGANTDLSNLSDTGKANISAQGTYDAGATYAAGTVGAAIKSSANTDLSNLTATGANIANWSSNVSNCITKIPQDIKVEISNGSLVLKAGSKLYVPNGSGVFDAVTLSDDKTTTLYYGTQSNILIFYNVVTGNLSSQGASLSFSGDTAPTGFYGNYAQWYDTAENKIKRTTDGGTTWQDTLSFPIASVTTTSNVVTSIDQVFNGFGYIGSTVFTLPGVKGLYPRGRNTDGTLMSGSIDCTSVQLSSTFNDTKKHVLIIQSNGKCQWYAVDGVRYDETDNMVYATSTGNYLYVGLFGTFNTTSGKISNFERKEVFHALDYNDTEYIAHQAMPSGRYTNLTLPATGNTVTAPADGYIMIKKESGAAGESIIMQNYGNGCIETRYSRVSGEIIGFGLRVSKGDIITVNYTATGTTTYFRFVYANGSK